eukprot:TRINITY_DN16489_c0_g2_i1.p1 TRINITY_DN16489_c0_g2~~TRINITY_DN16489_c0_g2_i1.p1  ORF type:complete len:103 (-),score=21.40 TRINITY_DN16489_c0_g2_i1:9-317(-)
MCIRYRSCSHSYYCAQRTTIYAVCAYELDDGLSQDWINQQPTTSSVSIRCNKSNHSRGGNDPVRAVLIWWCTRCLLYTSDAADDLLCVDLGGRRIIKKKTQY